MERSEGYALILYNATDLKQTNKPKKLIIESHSLKTLLKEIEAISAEKEFQWNDVFQNKPI